MATGDKVRYAVARRRFREHLEQFDELAHMVLKGHLLIEEALNDYLRSFFVNSEFIEQGNLRFIQKVNVARATDEYLEEDTWELVIAINALRNELAHSLDSPRLAPKVAQVRQIYLRCATRYEGVENHDKLPDHELVGMAAALCVEEILQLESTVHDDNPAADARLDEIIATQRNQFIEKFGREPSGTDPIFFDPQADTPVALDPKKIRAEFVKAMNAVKIPKERHKVLLRYFGFDC